MSRQSRSLWLVRSLALSVLMLLSLVFVSGDLGQAGHCIETVSLFQTEEPSNQVDIFGQRSKYSIVQIVAGDCGVSRAEVESVSRLIEANADTLLVTLGTFPSTPTRVFLYSTKERYEVPAEKVFPAARVPWVLSQTGGFTLDSTVYIPLYKYTSTPFLVNTLVHELTHVTLNSNYLNEKLPEWMNEGLAWYNGTQAEKPLDWNTSHKMSLRLFRELCQARDTGQLQAIAATGVSDFLKDPPYNVEFQDYLGVRHLIRTYGLNHLKMLLQGLKQMPFDVSFQRVYGQSAARFANTFTGVGPLHDTSGSESHPRA